MRARVPSSLAEERSCDKCKSPSFISFCRRLPYQIGGRDSLPLSLPLLEKNPGSAPAASPPCHPAACTKRKRETVSALKIEAPREGEGEREGGSERLRRMQQVVPLHLRESGAASARSPVRSFVRSFNIRNGVRRLRELRRLHRSRRARIPPRSCLWSPFDDG